MLVGADNDLYALAAAAEQIGPQQSHHRHCVVQKRRVALRLETRRVVRRDPRKRGPKRACVAKLGKKRRRERDLSRDVKRRDDNRRDDAIKRRFKRLGIAVRIELCGRGYVAANMHSAAHHGKELKRVAERPRERTRLGDIRQRTQRNHRDLAWEPRHGLRQKVLPRDVGLAAQRLEIKLCRDGDVAETVCAVAELANLPAELAL
eukprot:Amastigsp_a853893_6.p2 type:complete len:205 gc:universal Amastigsp_a853893_6:985-371(-)